MGHGAKQRTFLAQLACSLLGHSIAKLAASRGLTEYAHIVSCGGIAVADELHMVHMNGRFFSHLGNHILL